MKKGKEKSRRTNKNPGSQKERKNRTKVGLIRCLQTEEYCPGKNAISRAAELKERGAEKIVLASCILRGAPGNIDYVCPFGRKMKKRLNSGPVWR